MSVLKSVACSWQEGLSRSIPVLVEELTLPPKLHDEEGYSATWLLYYPESSAQILFLPLVCLQPPILGVAFFIISWPRSTGEGITLQSPLP